MQGKTFTEKEKGHILEILKDYDPECVEQFISQLEYILYAAFLLKDQSKIGAYKLNLETKNDTLKAALKVVRQIKKTDFVFPEMRSFADFYEQNIGKSWVENQSLAIGAYRDLEKIIDNLSKEIDGLKIGRGNPGTIRRELGSQIADAYEKHIERPKSTQQNRYGKKGEFDRILRYAFKIAGLPHKDVSNILKEVVSKNRI